MATTTNTDDMLRNFAIQNLVQQVQNQQMPPAANPPSNAYNPSWIHAGRGSGGFGGFGGGGFGGGGASGSW